MRLSGIGYKVLIIAGALTLFALPAFAVSVNPLSAVSCNNIEYDTSDDLDNTLFIYNVNSGVYIGEWNGGDNTGIGFVCPADFNYSLTPTLTFLPVGNYSIIHANSQTADCYSLNYNDCKASGSFIDEAIFSITNNFITPTSTVPNLLAAVGDQFGDTGTLGVITIAAGLPLAFWVIRKFLFMMPK